MINLSANAQAVMSSQDPEFFYFIAIRGPLGNVLYAESTLSSEIVISGVTYSSNNRLTYIDPPTVASNVDRGQFKVVFADEDDSMTSTFLGETLVGKTLEVYLGFFDEEGLPLTSISDALMIFKGMIDTFAKEIENSELGTNTLAVTAGSNFINLDEKKFVYVSKDFIRARHAKDSCADFVRVSGSSVSLRWGKI
jgi:hypothetical protein